MRQYMVLYRIHSIMSDKDDPFGFDCMADDPDHAREQAFNAYPDCEVVYVEDGVTYQEALVGYWDSVDPWNCVQ